MQYPLPTQQELTEYYDRSYSDGLYKTFADAEAMKAETAAARFESVAGRLPSGRWLDVGCSSGQFVACARERGIDCEGIDVSAVAVDRGRSRGLPLAVAAIEDWTPSSAYDAITCFDVVEHVLDPAAFVADAHRLLKPGGALVITVPNLASLSRQVMGRRWYFYIPEEHLHYFRPSTLQRLVSNHGFVVTHTGAVFKPMTFDYALTQFREYNPLIHAVLATAGRLVPRRLAAMAWPVPAGEMCAVARRR
jgi:2-polyprenyl-3-methyl-5-hydroxy-6-metoxy-1,4-benzoquinol methylase